VQYRDVSLQSVSCVRSVSPDPFQSPTVSLRVIFKLDYCNAVLVGLPVHLMRRQQSVLNAAARLLRSPHHCCACHSLAFTGCVFHVQRIEYKMRPCRRIKCYIGVVAPRFLGSMVPVADLLGRRILGQFNFSLSLSLSESKKLGLKWLWSQRKLSPGA